MKKYEYKEVEWKGEYLSFLSFLNSLAKEGWRLNYIPLDRTEEKICIFERELEDERE